MERQSLMSSTSRLIADSDMMGYGDGDGDGDGVFGLVSAARTWTGSWTSGASTWTWTGRADEAFERFQICDGTVEPSCEASCHSKKASHSYPTRLTWAEATPALARVPRLLSCRPNNERLKSVD
jgi:hypothetical protein